MIKIPGSKFKNTLVSMIGKDNFRAINFIVFDKKKTYRKIELSLTSLSSRSTMSITICEGKSITRTTFYSKLDNYNQLKIL